MKKINSKKKGNVNERKIANLFSDIFNEKFKRVPMSGGFVGGSRYEKELREDAIEILSGDLITPKNFLFNVEIKARKDFNFFDFFSNKSEINNWIVQSEFDAKKSKKESMLIIIINYHKPFVLIKKKCNNFVLKYKEWYIIELDEILKENKSYFFNLD